MTRHREQFQGMTARALGLVMLACVACTGSFRSAGDGSRDETPSDEPGGRGGSAGRGGAGAGGSGGTKAPVAAAPARMRRLTQLELKRSIADVFGGPTLDTVRFPVEIEHGHFDNRFETLAFTQDFGDALATAAEATGAFVAGRLATLLPCDAAKLGDRACLGQFLETFGTRLFRRPLRDDERARLGTLFDETRKVEDFATSIATVVEALVQSPAFVFRTELGLASGRRTPLAPHETAAALSYFFLRTTPDAALLAAAAKGALSTPQEVSTHARRLLADPRAQATVRDFFLQWLEMTAVADINKSDPAFSPALAESMLAETVRFVDDAWSQPDGYARLLTSPESFVDARLAPLYGVPAPAGKDPVAVKLDPARRAGFLTQPGFIASHTPGAERSPIVLGHFVRSKLFCQELPPPPPGVPPLPMDPSLDVVARFKLHQNDPGCAGCHALMDPIGFGFSQYDVLGRYAPVDRGVTQTGEGTLTKTDVDGAFRGPVELARKLAESEAVKRCFAATALGYALGREAWGGDALPIDDQTVDRALAAAFAGGDLKELFVALATSDAFLLRDTTALPGGL